MSQQQTANNVLDWANRNRLTGVQGAQAFPNQPQQSQDVTLSGQQTTPAATQNAPNQGTSFGTSSHLAGDEHEEKQGTKLTQEQLAALVSGNMGGNVGLESGNLLDLINSSHSRQQHVKEGQSGNDVVNEEGEVKTATLLEMLQQKTNPGEESLNRNFTTPDMPGQ